MVQWIENYSIPQDFKLVFLLIEYHKSTFSFLVINAAILLERVRPFSMELYRKATSTHRIHIIIISFV